MVKCQIEINECVEERIFSRYIVKEWGEGVWNVNGRLGRMGGKGFCLLSSPLSARLLPVGQAATLSDGETETVFAAWREKKQTYDGTCEWEWMYRCRLLFPHLRFQNGISLSRLFSFIVKIRESVTWWNFNVESSAIFIGYLMFFVLFLNVEIWTSWVKVNSWEIAGEKIRI